MRTAVLSLCLLFLLQAGAAAYEIIKSPELKISGYTQLGYARDNSTTAGNYTFEDHFKLYKSRFTFKADIDPKVSMNVQMDVAAKNVSGNLINILTDAYLDAKYLKGHIIRFGQFKLPLGLENPIPDSKTFPVNSSMVKTLCLNTRDIGIDVSAKTGNYEYHAGLVNGTGANKSDDNTGKDVYAAGAIVSDRLRAGGAMLSSSGRTSVNTLKRIMNGFVQYTPVWGEVDIEAFRGSDKNNKKRFGWYASVIPQLNPRTWLVLRYENYDPNVTVSSGQANKTTLGILYQASKYTKFKLNYEWRNDKSVTTEGDALLFLWQVEY